MVANFTYLLRIIISYLESYNSNIGLIGRVFANDLGDLDQHLKVLPGFNLRLRHTKDFKNGSWYLLA